MEDVDPISVSCAVQVQVEGSVATVSVPPELRLTERLVSFLSAALKERDLKLEHWIITTPEQKKELENLPNVKMGQAE
jgi:hypothetical protein